MTYLLALTVVAYAATVLVLVRQHDLYSQEENRRHRDQIDQTHLSHRQEVAALNQARTAEVADLLQRIQAPEQAVTSHVADSAGPDPPPLNLENDLEMFEAREQRLKDLGVIADG